MEKFSNATLFRQIALQNLQRKNLWFSETELLGKAIAAEASMLIVSVSFVTDDRVT